MEAEAVNETAGPEVVDDKPGTALVKVETDLEEYKDLVDGLNEMLKLKGIAYALTTVKGNDQARKDRAKLKSTKTAIEKRCADRKRELKASVAAKVERLEVEADRFLTIVSALYTPIDEQITADEVRRAREQKERDDAEAARQANHRQRIAAISDVAIRAVGLPSAEIAAKIALVTRLVIDDTYEEFEASATNAKASTLLTLQELHAAVRAEEAAAEAKRNAERLAQLERENAERAARETQEKREREAREAEARAAEQRAADARRAQSRAAEELVDEIRRVQRRGMTASANGMLELVTLIEAIQVRDELGDFGGSVLKAKEDALVDLQELHATALAAEKRRREEALERERVQAEQDARQRRLDEQAAEVQRQQDAVAEQQRIVEAAAEAAKPAVAEPAPLVPFASLAVSEQSTVLEPAVVIGVDPGSPAGDMTAVVNAEHGALTDAADEIIPEDPVDPDVRLLACVVQVMKAATSTMVRGRKPGPWVVPLAEMLALKAALRAMPLPGDQFYAEDGTLMNADGTRSVFDDVDE